MLEHRDNWLHCRIEEKIACMVQQGAVMAEQTCLLNTFFFLPAKLTVEEILFCMKIFKIVSRYDIFLARKKK